MDQNRIGFAIQHTTALFGVSCPSRRIARQSPHLPKRALTWETTDRCSGGERSPIWERLFVYSNVVACAYTRSTCRLYKAME